MLRKASKKSKINYSLECLSLLTLKETMGTGWDLHIYALDVVKAGQINFSFRVFCFLVFVLFFPPDFVFKTHGSISIIATKFYTPLEKV